MLAHYSTSGARALLESARPAASRFNSQLKWSFAVLIFAVVIDTKQIYSVGRGRSRSLPVKKPKVNFVDASSCDCGMEISAAVSRLFLSFSSNHLRLIERANELAPHPDPAGFLSLNSTIEKVETRARPGANERTASAADPRKMIPCARRRGRRGALAM